MTLQKWGIDRPDEVYGLSDERLAEEMRAAIDHGVFSPLARAVFVEMRDRFISRPKLELRWTGWQYEVVQAPIPEDPTRE